jgi:hypothetical protein
LRSVFTSQFFPALLTALIIDYVSDDMQERPCFR